MPVPGPNTKIRGAEAVATNMCVRACVAIEGIIVAYYYVSFRLWFAGQLAMAMNKQMGGQVWRV